MIFRSAKRWLKRDNLQTILSTVETLKIGHYGGHLYLIGKTDYYAAVKRILTVIMTVSK